VVLDLGIKHDGLCQFINFNLEVGLQTYFFNAFG